MCLAFRFVERRHVGVSPHDHSPFPPKRKPICPQARFINNRNGYSQKEMRIDPKGKICGYPALQVRKTLCSLRAADNWGLLALEEAVKLSPGTGRTLANALQKNGLIELREPGRWTVTQAGRTIAAATAAHRISRSTAEKAFAQFLDRVIRANSEPYFLARVTRLVLYGSMLRPEVEWLSDVDVAVQLEAKEKDFDRFRAQTLDRVDDLAARGHRFRDFLEREGFGIGWSAPCADWGAGRTSIGGRTGSSETGTTEAPATRLSVLSGRKGQSTITPLELSLTADASRGSGRVLSSFERGKFGSQGGPCDPFTKVDAR
jgi:predicted nucleotidyltransferase